MPSPTFKREAPGGIVSTKSGAIEIDLTREVRNLHLTANEALRLAAILIQAATVARPEKRLGDFIRILAEEVRPDFSY